MTYTLRAYAPSDETAWIRCRVVAFLDTAYYDSVEPAKPAVAAPGLELVAVDGQGTIVGIMDTGVEGDLATIETVAIHPDHRRRGLAGELLARTRTWARTMGASVLDAWTRDDADAIGWYRAAGFAESDHYLHVYAFHYADPSEPRRAVIQAGAGLKPIQVFAHAPLAEEARLRAEFGRVHVCRRFSTAI